MIFREMTRKKAIKAMKAIQQECLESSLFCGSCRIKGYDENGNINCPLEWIGDDIKPYNWRIPEE